MFSGYQEIPFKEIIADSLREANYVDGYGRYLKNNRSGPEWEMYAQDLEEGLAIVKEARAIRQSLYSVETEIKDLEQWWEKKQVDNPEWTRDEEDTERKAFEKKLLKLEKKFVGEAWRLVGLRIPLEQVLMYLDLEPRRKYQRRQKTEKSFSAAEYERHQEKENID